jgi:hypothetical protein
MKTLRILIKKVMSYGQILRSKLAKRREKSSPTDALQLEFNLRNIYISEFFSTLSSFSDICCHILCTFFLIIPCLGFSHQLTLGMEEIQVTYSHFLLFCHPCPLSLCKKICFRTYLRNRTSEDPFSFAWITSYNDRTTKKCISSIAIFIRFFHTN